MDIASGLRLEPSVSFPLSTGTAGSLHSRVRLSCSVWKTVSHLTFTIFLPPLPKTFLNIPLNVPNIPLNGKQLPFEADFIFSLSIFVVLKQTKASHTSVSPLHFPHLVSGCDRWKDTGQGSHCPHLPHVSALSSLLETLSARKKNPVAQSEAIPAPSAGGWITAVRGTHSCSDPSVSRLFILRPTRSCHGSGSPLTGPVDGSHACWVGNSHLSRFGVGSSPRNPHLQWGKEGSRIVCSNVPSRLGSLTPDSEPLPHNNTKEKRGRLRWW